MAVYTDALGDGCLLHFWCNNHNFVLLILIFLVYVAVILVDIVTVLVGSKEFFTIRKACPIS